MKKLITTAFFTSLIFTCNIGYTQENTTGCGTDLVVKLLNKLGVELTCTQAIQSKYVFPAEITITGAISKITIKEKTTGVDQLPKLIMGEAQALDLNADIKITLTEVTMKVDLSTEDGTFTNSTTIKKSTKEALQYIKEYLKDSGIKLPSWL